jgi:LmbE family N-acetylglucosaminyl deacetylase
VQIYGKHTSSSGKKYINPIKKRIALLPIETVLGFRSLKGPSDKKPMKSYDHIFLSPHFDDAVLSCGGTIHQYVRLGVSVLVVNVCSAAPDGDEPLSDLARYFHEGMGHPDRLVEARRAEDEIAIARLGADVMELRWKDCIYRGQPRDGFWYYTDVHQVFSSVHPEEEKLAYHLATAINELAGDHAGATIYIPLGVGGHVDHQIAYKAGWILDKIGRYITFYEDYPYADDEHPHPYDPEHTSSLASILAADSNAGLKPRMVSLTDMDMQAKTDSVCAYDSQISMIFGDKTAVAPRLMRFATRFGQPTERYWFSSDQV